MQSPKNHVFKFEVDEYGKFTFERPDNPDGSDDWKYATFDHVTIQTTSGSFRLRLIPIGTTALYRDPLGSPLAAKTEENGVWKVGGAVNDGLTEGERRAIRIGNAPPGKALGFIAKYRYDIEVTRTDGKVFRSQEHNGEHGC